MIAAAAAERDAAARILSLTAMAPNLDAATLYRFLRDDFIAAWDAMVATQPDARGNFLFMRQALAILELACRVCENSGVGLDRLGKELEIEDPRYFTELPGQVSPPKDFELPSRPARTAVDRQLLSAIYELGRHGLAHQGQQIPAELSDGAYFGLSLTGVGHQKMDEVFVGGGKPAEHLMFRRPPENQNVWLVIRPDVLFLDLRRAIERAGIFSAGDDHAYLTRSYPFDSASLVDALSRQGHLSD